VRSVAALVLLLALAGCQGSPEADPSLASTPSQTPTQTPTQTTVQRGLLARLSADPVVVDELFGREPRGVVLCGTDMLGRANGERYAWLSCGAYRTGPDAESLSGGADAVVIRRGGQVEFPRHDLEAEIDRLFPPEVARAIRYREFAPSPSDDELLALATAAAPAAAPSQ
jgi:hypothetical protein